MTGISASNVLDLSAWTGAVPARVVERIAAARTVLAISHENPDADTLGASLAISLIVGAHGGRTTLVCQDAPPALYGFMPGIDRFRTDPEAGLDYDLLAVSDCGTLDRVGDVGKRHA
ncbi:MAG TPA: hypothetical protein VK656_03360, partial [Candidatus Acidoferrum sp.]|nr:hypothetical protein [Candidatus Acidoferrum sp.]